MIFYKGPQTDRTKKSYISLTLLLPAFSRRNLYKFLHTYFLFLDDRKPFFHLNSSEMVYQTRLFCHLDHTHLKYYKDHGLLIMQMLAHHHVETINGLNPLVTFFDSTYQLVDMFFLS